MQSFKLVVLLFVSLAFCGAQAADAFQIGPSLHPLPVSPTQLAKIQNLANQMYDRWSALDQACDPRAVFAVAYLYMTANAARLVNIGYFDDGNKMADFISHFAARYITAYDNFESGNLTGVSAPWTINFNFLKSNRSDVTQDITLGMNAHINYDLGIATYEMGYARPNLTADYYRVNDLMHQVDDNITLALGRYDPQFYNTDFISQTYFTASVEFVTSWRTGAYTQATLYQAADDILTGVTGLVTGLLGGLNGATVATLEATSEATAVAATVALVVPYPTPTAPSRIAYCMTQNTQPLPGYASR